MGNMSYCRFENTAQDIADCIEALDANNWDIEDMIKNASSDREKIGMRNFIRLCRNVAENLNNDDAG